jgi:hypothetical protein
MRKKAFTEKQSKATQKAAGTFMNRIKKKILKPRPDPTRVIPTEECYHVFSRYGSGELIDWSKPNWYYHGEFDTKEDAESEMTQTGEPENITYLVIKGTKLETEEGIATYPTRIKDKP